MLKTLKSKIALVAVAALGSAGLAVVAAPVANAAVGAAQTGTVTPVRVSFTGTVRDAVPAASLTFTNNGAAALTKGATNDATIVLSQAPTSTAEVTVTLPGTGTISDTLGAAATNIANTDTVLAANFAAGASLTVPISISANAAAGTYRGQIVLDDAAGTNTVTVNFSFTTAGAPKTIEIDKTAVSLPAIAHNAGAFVASQTVVVSMKDANGAATQIGTGDTLTASLVDNANIGMVDNAQAATVTITDADLADNSYNLVIGSKTVTADSETLTITPNGVLPGLGVVAKTLTATSVAYGATTAAVTTVTSPSSSAVILKNASAAQTDYSVDPGAAAIVAETSGLEAGKAYRIGVVVTNVSGGGAPVGTYSVAGATAAAFTAGAVANNYGIADATGKVTTTVAFTTLLAATDTVEINVTTDDADYTDTSDLKVTATASANTITLTAPATSPSVAVTGATTPVAGTIADQYGNPFVGATVTIVGVQTLSSGTASNLTAQAVTDNTGKFSATLAAANALTTSIALTIDAARGGVSATQKTATVNFNAGGAATAIVWAGIGDEDTATTATLLPSIAVPFNDGVTSGVSDELWDVATGAAQGDHDATDECVAIEINTTPLAQVTATGSDGVLFSTAICAAQKLSDLKNTATVASVTVAAGNNLWVTSTKTGKNTVTLTSGGVSKTLTFYAQNFLTAATKGAAARDIVLDSATKTLSGGEIGFVTATVVDTFGNAVEQATGVSTVRAAITGAALLDGPSLSKSGLLAGSDGKITLGVIAGNAAGSATLTVTGVNGTGGQNGALVGAATSTTTAGTNTAFKASANVKTATITVAAGSSKTDTEVAAVKADVKAVSDTVATLSKAVTTIQSSVTELTSSFSAQIKSLSSAIAKISRAIAALSKKIK